MSGSWFVYKGFQPLSFRAPSSLAAASHGPGVGGFSLPYPFPSTLAGALGFQAYSSQPQACSGQGAGGAFDDIDACLQQLLGQEYHLYTGMAWDTERDTLLYYTEHGYLDINTITSDIAVRVACSSREGQSPPKGKKPARMLYTGIALNRATKSVAKSLLYTLEYHDIFSANMAYLVLAVHSGTTGIGRRPIRLGGEARTAILEETSRLGDIDPEPEKVLVEGSGTGKWLLFLLSPALLDTSPWDICTPVLLSDNYAEKLASLLLQGTGLSGRVLRVPKDPIGLTVIAPGWSTRDKRPRRPHLYVPPGTMVEVRRASRSDVEALVERGLGLHTRIGWGTVLAVKIDC